MANRMFRLLRADEIECRVSTINEKGLTLLLYKDARCDMNILDETVGPMNWQDVYSRDNANCKVGIYDPAKDAWVWKENVGTPSQTEAEKGLASDSFKRACFNWGIGRELYTAPFIWVSADKCDIRDNPRSKDKKMTYDKFEVSSIGYDENGRINSLSIINKNRKSETVYTLGKTRSNVHTEEQAHEKGADAVRKKKIGQARAEALVKHIFENGIEVDTICELYKVSAMKDLTEEQHRNIVQNISKIKEAQDAKKSKAS